MRHMWTYNKTQQDYYIDMMSTLIAEELAPDSEIDYWERTTVWKLLKNPDTPKTLKEKLKKWWSKN